MINGMKEKMGIVDKMTLSILGTHAHSTCYCAQSTHSELCEHCYLTRSNGEQ